MGSGGRRSAYSSFLLSAEERRVQTNCKSRDIYATVCSTMARHFSHLAAWLPWLQRAGRSDEKRRPAQNRQMRSGKALCPRFAASLRPQSELDRPPAAARAQFDRPFGHAPLLLNPSAAPFLLNPSVPASSSCRAPPARSPLRPKSELAM